jgi:hypothetical protein
MMTFWVKLRRLREPMTLYSENGRWGRNMDVKHGGYEEAR